MRPLKNIKETTMENDTLDSPKSLKHYTNFYSLISILSTKSLYLSDPAGWEDKNDFASVDAFARSRSCSVRIFCLTYEEEAVHHWNTYAEGMTGCRIDFNTGLFLKKVESIPGLICRKMEYLKYPFDLSKYKADDYPFIKRNPYKCDMEYRVVWAGKGKPPVIPTDGLIKRVTLSPYMKDNVRDSVCNLIKDKYKIKEVCKSAILNYPQWTGLFEKKPARKKNKA